ncbi:MAG TPA: hypothetical protein VKE73_13050 [Myxococcota bacterium]|nr:hypothetical protein [Myxococcota bacterium]
MIRVRVRHLAAVDPMRELASTAQLMASVARGRERGEGGAIQLATLRGEARALGRYQQLARVLETPLGEPGPAQSADLVRRWTGGHATAYGDGILSISLILPGPSAWLSAAESIPAEKLLNRHVRGLLRAFSALGAPAFYPGRDCVTVSARPVAYVSCERDAFGVCLVQAVVGLSRPYRAEKNARPGPEEEAAGAQATFLAELVRGPADLGERVGDAVLSAYAARHALSLDVAPLSELESQAVAEREARLRLHGPREDSVEGMVGSGLFATPIGGLEAFVALEQSRTLGRVRILGDFIADSAGVAELEEALRMRPADWHSVDGAVERILGGPEHFTLGLRERQTVTHAVLEAARRAAGPEAVA